MGVFLCMAADNAGFPQWDISGLGSQGEALLKSSWEAARIAGEPRDSSVSEGESGVCKAKQWVPFDKQTPVREPEKLFQIRPGMYLASEFGATSAEVFDAFKIDLVLNITSGERKVPNKFADQGVTYINYEVTDQPGEDIMTRGIREGTVEISRALDLCKVVLVHCSAGLSRSASVTVAWLMVSENFTLAQAVEEVNFRRGRRLQINPTFWMSLARWERELHGLQPRTPPSFDFTQWWLEDFGLMGFQENAIKHALVEVGDWVNFELAFEAMLTSTS